MAPPRQQRTTVADDSRSEASSGPRESTKTTVTSKGRKGTNAGNSSRTDGKTSAANVTSAPAQHQQADDLPNIPWSDLSLEILHAYRHAYNLPIPSAYGNSYSQILLSQGIGLRSPSYIAAQRAQQQQRPAASSSSSSSSSATKRHHNRHSNNSRKHASTTNKNNSNSDGSFDEKNSLNRIIGQNRVSKEQLALAVRKHFNSAGLAEQETIARFLYKVREEGKGRQFRLRFQP